MILSASSRCKKVKIGKAIEPLVNNSSDKTPAVLKDTWNNYTWLYIKPWKVITYFTNCNQYIINVFNTTKTNSDKLNKIISWNFRISLLKNSWVQNELKCYNIY